MIDQLCGVAGARHASLLVIGLSMVVWVSSTAVSAAEKAAAPVFRAGFAERDISPDIGMEQPGGYGKSYHRSFHDPCKVRAAVFDDGKTRVALVGIDALTIERATVNRVRQRITQHTGIPGAAVMLAATHSHSSGPMCFIMPGEFDDAPEWVQDLAYKQSTCANPAYLKRVETAIVGAVTKADKKRADVVAGVGRGVEDQVAFNRRFHMRNGLTVTHPRQGNPDIVKVAGPTDPEVGVIGAWDAKGQLIGCVVNFACHATTNPGGISANYIYYLEKVIRGTFGEHVIVVFLNGPSGDVTQVDNLSPEVLRRGEVMARFVGARVGAEAVKVLVSMDNGKLVPLAAKQTVLHIPRRVPDPERVKQCTQLARQDPKTVDRTKWTFAKEIVLLEHRIKKQPVVDVEVQAIQVGPVVFLSCPAEYFSQYGLDIKRHSPFPFTFPVALANGCVGYVPTREAFGPHGGGYETRLTSYSNLEIGAGDEIEKTCLDLARQLEPGKVPHRAKVPPFRGAAWSYGNVPPERK